MKQQIYNTALYLRLSRDVYKRQPIERADSLGSDLILDFPAKNTYNNHIY